MKVNLSIIKHMIKTGAAIDVTNENIRRRPPRSTVIFYSTGANGLNGVVIRDDITGDIYAVAGRVSNLFILAA